VPVLRQSYLYISTKKETNKVTSASVAVLSAGIRIGNQSNKKENFQQLIKIFRQVLTTERRKTCQNDFTHRQKFELNTVPIRSKMPITVHHRNSFLRWRCYRQKCELLILSEYSPAMTITDKQGNLPITLAARCRHELPSPAQTMGSWVRIPLKAWMSLCVYSVFLLSYVQVAALRWADPPSKESYRLCIGLRN
jgi:hypothetical protein